VEVEPDIHNVEDKESQTVDTKPDIDSLLIATNEVIEKSSKPKSSNKSTPKNKDENSFSGDDSSDLRDTEDFVSNPLVKIFDNDPAIFHPDERLKVGVMRRKSVCENRKFQCHYCTHSCESNFSLKIHIRIVHLPTVVYDSPKGYGGNAGEHVGCLDSEGESDEGCQMSDNEENLSEERFNYKTKRRMGVKLVNLNSGSKLNGSTLDKPFVCLFCENSYKLSSSLQSHYRDSHSPVKPHKCQLCPASFRKNMELNRHKMNKCKLVKQMPKT